MNIINKTHKKIYEAERDRKLARKLFNCAVIKLNDIAIEFGLECIREGSSIKLTNSNYPTNLIVAVVLLPSIGVQITSYKNSTFTVDISTEEEIIIFLVEEQLEWGIAECIGDYYRKHGALK